MSENMFRRYRCWDPTRVHVVINKDAIAVDRAHFLATHTPFDRINYLKTPTRAKTTDESELLIELQRCTNNNLHTFAVVQGNPGTGKSHLIRWLKERYVSYVTKNAQNVDVLLIERSNNSLRQTLLQILRSNVFAGESFDRQRRKLESATRQLSEEGLEESLISNLDLALSEVAVAPERQLPHSLSARLHIFLLDHQVRAELRRDNGPIKRIARFLSGTNSRPDDDLQPHFTANDFEFSVEVRARLTNPSLGGYEQTRHLVKKLELPEHRNQLAAFLNELLDFAITQSTSLTADDLKGMFNDLREALRQQGRSLALFIEDVTNTFTGLDSGLLDVLVTQHTGEGNEAFCRLISVIGVTDAHFEAKFPTNVRQRITHHLSLNALEQGSLLLSEPDMIPVVSSRYLNAIRLPDEELQAWYAKDGDEDSLPIACTECPYRAPCHAAFGYVDLGRDNAGNDQHVGLYPFNETALKTMYGKLDLGRVSGTPRSLLDSVLHFVLHNHSELIDEGAFPPARNQLGNDFDAPTLLKPQQRQLLNRPGLSPRQREQIESLLVFWGDRTLDDTTVRDGRPSLGSVPFGVFEAFDLPFIGDRSGPSVVDPPVLPPIQPVVLVPPPPSPAVVPTHNEDPLIVEIENWLTGKQLRSYNQLAERLKDFVNESIDWEGYGISYSLVNERMTTTAFTFEGQTGRAQAYHLTFPRSAKLAYALQALHQLGPRDKLSLAATGSHLVALYSWLEQNEEAIVRFVREPSEEPSGCRPVLAYQATAAVGLACLSGDLPRNGRDLRDVYFSVLKSSRNRDWQQAVLESASTRGSRWLGLMKRYDVTTNASVVRTEFLKSLNCPQGEARHKDDPDVWFFNAADLLDLLKELEHNDWQMPPPPSEPEGRTWRSVIDIYVALRDHLATVLAEEHRILEDITATLDALLGSCSKVEIERAIQKGLAAFKEANEPYDEAKYGLPDLAHYDSDLGEIHQVLDETTTSGLGMALSASLELTKRLQSQRSYFEELMSMFNMKKAKWQAELDGDDASAKATQSLLAEVNQGYTEAKASLARLSQGEI